MTKEVSSFNLDESVKRVVEDCSALLGISQSDFVSKAVSHYVKDHLDAIHKKDIRDRKLIREAIDCRNLPLCGSLVVGKGEDD